MNERERLQSLIFKAFVEYSKTNKARFRSGFITDYLLENGVMVLPCKTGDEVFWIENNKIIKSGTAWQFGYEGYLWLTIKVSKAKVVVLKCSCLYFTKEEAEQVLEKERKKNEHNQL